MKADRTIIISVKARFKSKTATKDIEALLKLLEKRACAFKLGRTNNYK